jgi:DNA-binding transcriptional LysR family regulator
MRLLRTEADLLGRDLRLRVQVRSFDAMSRMVRAGIGLGILPHAGVIDHATSMGLRLVELDEPWAHRHLLVGWRDRDALDRPAVQLLDALAARSGKPVTRAATPTRRTRRT